jgi:hypothetical protein
VHVGHGGARPAASGASAEPASGNVGPRTSSNVWVRRALRLFGAEARSASACRRRRNDLARDTFSPAIVKAKTNATAIVPNMRT